MKNKTLFVGALTVIFLTSCSKKETIPSEPMINNADSTAVQVPADSLTTATPADMAHTSQNSLDWNGTYEATVPCADCPGIKTSLTLNKDNTFSLTEEYIDRKTKDTDNGTFEWDSTGNIITLNGKTSKYKYKVGENKLIQLDLEGKDIEGPNKDLYVFKKK
ncbi:copper resistance protein NlpE [Chryseobacterium sp.]|mgnify:CR=1 FL=1|uniref:copper resistance protein NlpE n=1 Tax=Chryseobacterium sp. TaxID=1871047 RepID=UPI0025C69F25|nr:copper resistance protein NlpE [Chryseobacterium sp.]